MDQNRAVMSSQFPKPLSRFLVGVLFVGSVGCRPSADATFSVSRETLPNGALMVRYASLPEPSGPPVEPDLRLGDSEEDMNAVFGDVRGIEADDAGTIYVLDYQASEIRAFDPQGNYLRTVVSQGQGPGEIVEANGMILVEDTVLWIQDYNKWQMIKMSTSGRELETHPMHVHSYGYIWSGTIDDVGRIWKPWYDSRPPEELPPPEGVQTGATTVYLVSFDPDTGANDTLRVGAATYRSFVKHMGRGYTSSGIPFDPGAAMSIDPGGGFWRAETGTYRIVKHDALGDTALVITASADPLPVTNADKREFLDSYSSAEPARRQMAEDIVALMPDRKPILAGLDVDDVGRLWVRRAVASGEHPRYDVFGRDGEYLGSLSLGFELARYYPIRVRNDRIYALSTDSLGVPVVVRTAPLGLGRP